MEIEVPDNPRSEGSVSLASDPPLENKDDDHQPSTGPLLDKDNDDQPFNSLPLDKQDDHPTSTDNPLDNQDDFLSSAGPVLDEKDDHLLSIDPPVLEKQYDHPPSSSCSSGFEQGKTCDSTCVNRSAETQEKALALSIAKKIKREPMEKKVKEEPIDLEDDCDIRNSRNDDDDDDDDCIIVLDVVHADKKRMDKPKAISDEIVLISDDEDSIKGDEEPSVSTSSQNMKPREKVATVLTADSSVSEDIQVDQAITVTDINASHSTLKESGEGGDSISKAVCEVVKEFTDRPSTASSVVDSEDESNATIEDVSGTVPPSSPGSLDGSDKVSEDVTTNQLGWTEDNLKDTSSVPEPAMEEESTDLANVVSEQDDEAQDLEDVDIPFGDGYDSDGWEVDSDDDSNKNATKTDNTADKGTETEQRSDVTRRQEDIDANPRSVQIIPLDSDLTTRQDNSVVPIGIIPIASEVNTRLDDGVPPLTTDKVSCRQDGTGESGKHTVVSPAKKEKAALLEPTPAASDLKSMTQDDSDSPGLRRQSKQMSEASIDHDIRAAVARSKLRSYSNLLKEENEKKIPPGKCVKENLPDVVKGNLPPDNPVFNCHLCFHSFTKKKLLEEHLLNHPKVTRIMCKYCNTSFQRQRNLNNHLKRCYNRKKRKSPRKTLHGDPQNSKRVKNENGDRAGRSEQLSSLSKERRKLDFSAKKECPSIKAEGAHHNSPKQSKVNLNLKCNKKQKNQNLKGNTDRTDAKLEGIMKFKDNTTVWLCPKCHGSFTSRSKVKRHMFLTHSGISAKDSLQELKTMRKEEAPRLIYYCSTCKESFRSEYCFDRHESTKKGRKRCGKLFQCNLCFKHFDKKVHCASHVQEHLKPVESKKRKRSSSSPTERQSNKKRAKVNEFKCRYCRKKFEQKYLCVKHELTHTDRDPFHCYICFKIFYLDSSIIAHMEKAHKEASYCKKCYCIMTSKDKKLCIDCDKRRVGSGLKCSICKTEFVKPSDLTLHILTHVESGVETSVVNAPKASKVSLDPQISVAIHPPSMSRKTSKKRTISVNNIGPVTRLQKEVLSKKNPTTNTIPHKSSVAHKQKTSPLSRPKQDYRRVTRSLSESLPPEALTTKTVEHTHSKYDVCMKCREQDISPKELSKHARTHLDVRSRYQCNACQQCFVNMYEIEEHGCVPNHQASCSYTVSNVVYQCQFCGRAFQNMIEARKHVLSTNTSCLLECTECKAEYSRQGDLMVHMVSIHGQYLECDKCSAQFTRQVDLDYHARQHEDMSY